MPSKERKGKWQPFDALDGYSASLRKVEFEKDKIPKPIIMPDALEELNDKLNSAIESENEVKVSYYKNGYIYDINGIISKVDPIKKEIIIDSTKIKMDCIVEISD